MADNCSDLAGKTVCLTFVYSTGFSNSYTANFYAGGAFDLGAGSTGTYACPGADFVEVNYAFGGFEQQQWFGGATKKGKGLKGYGKSETNGYLYSYSSVPGACTVEAAPRSRQAD